MRVLIIANPVVGISKEKRSILEEITSAIKKHGGSVDVTYTIKPGIGRNLSSRAGMEGYDAIYAAGGDGTINDAASGLVGHKIPLGIIPLGTGNGLARGLGIPFDTKSLIEILLRNKITSIDTGKIASNIFLATAGIGFDARIAVDFNRTRKSKTNIMQYFYFAVRNYFLGRPEKLTLIVDGRELKRTVFALTICNLPQYGGGAIIAPQADPRSGKLIAVLIPKFGMFKALQVTPKLFNGTADEIKELEYLTFESLIIKRERADVFHVDGETRKGDSTLKVSVLPSSLKIITP